MSQLQRSALSVSPRSFSSTQPEKAYRLLRAILKVAVDDEKIRVNPCRIKGGGKESVPERPIALPETVLAIADAIDPQISRACDPRGVVLAAIRGAGGVATVPHRPPAPTDPCAGAGHKTDGRQGDVQSTEVRQRAHGRHPRRTGATPDRPSCGPRRACGGRSRIYQPGGAPAPSHKVPPSVGRSLQMRRRLGAPLSRPARLGVQPGQPSPGRLSRS
jgi:hypothetical protein